MSREATLSTLGLYEFDNTIFNLMVIPDALDRETLIENLLAETAELEVLYPNPDVLKNLIGVWSHKQLHIWQHLYETTQYEYNPIENYDRNETGTDTGSGMTTHGGADSEQISRTEGGSETDTLTNSGTDRTTSSSDTLHKIAGFNSAALVDQSQDVGTGTSALTHGKVEQDVTQFGKTENISNAKTYGQTITDTNNGTHTLRAHGNIGVTTTQEMIEQERKIALFNIYDAIIKDYIYRFCLLVY